MVFHTIDVSITVMLDLPLMRSKRYVVLNPVRVNMVKHIEEWHWSSYPLINHKTPISKSNKIAKNTFLLFII